jgi:uncharacterized protein YhaN
LRGRLEALIEHAPHVADLDDELVHLTGVRDKALQQLRALELAAATIEETTKAVHEALAPRLSQALTARLQQLTAGRYHAADVEASRFEVSLLGPERPEYVPLSLVSHGTRDQVSLLLRIALAEALGSGESIPLILDEPLLTSDDDRQMRALRFLSDLAQDQQVILTSCNAATVEALRGMTPDLAVVELSPAARVTVISGDAHATG